MASRYILYAVSLILLIASTNAAETVNGKIKITAGTTAGCGDTVKFINEQLLPTYEKYKEHLELEFIPWGRTVWHDDGTFSCQFNQHNCWANRLHRCVLNKLKHDQEAQLRYMACEFPSNGNSPSFIDGSYVCADKAGLNLKEVDYCVANPKDELDLEAQKRGTEILSEINFVPSIVINDNIDWDRHVEAFLRLESTVCFALANDATTGVTNCQF